MHSLSPSPSHTPWQASSQASSSGSDWISPTLQTQDHHHQEEEGGETHCGISLNTSLSQTHTLSLCQESVLAEAKEFAPCLAVDPAVLTRANIKKYTGLHNCCPHCTPSSKVDTLSLLPLLSPHTHTHTFSLHLRSIR